MVKLAGGSAGQLTAPTTSRRSDSKPEGHRDWRWSRRERRGAAMLLLLLLLLLLLPVSLVLLPLKLCGLKSSNRQRPLLCDDEGLTGDRLTGRVGSSRMNDGLAAMR